MAVQYFAKCVESHAEHSCARRRRRCIGRSRILRGNLTLFPIPDCRAARGQHERLLVFRYRTQRLGDWPGIPPVPAAIGPGASLAQLQSLGRIYALLYRRWNLRFLAAPVRKIDTTMLSNTPGPVNGGGALVGINYGTQSQGDVLYALQGGSSPAIWRYDVASDTWTHIGNLPLSPSRGPRR